MSRADLRLLVLAEHEEAIRAALANPGGVKHGDYYSGYTPGELAEKLRDVVSERQELEPVRACQIPAAAVEGRTSGPGRPAVLRQHRRNTLKLSHLVIAADVAVVAYVEKGLMAGHKATAGHPAVLPAHPAQLVIVGLVFALPALLILLVTWLRGRSAAVPAAPVRTSGYSSFGSRL